MALLVALCLASPASAEPAPTTRPAVDKPAATQPAGPKTINNDLGDLRIDEDALKDIELLNLQVPTVITAGRHEQKITDLPYAVSVITREDIRSAGASSVADAMRLVPGVEVAELSAGNFAVSPRGFNGITSNRVLVLVDGRQIFDNLFGATLWGRWPFQIEDIDRIEVIRGPGSVSWGANASSGVINIITRDPGEQEGVTVYGNGGSRGSHEEYLGYGFKADKLRMRVSGGYAATDGFNSGGSIFRTYGASLITPYDDGYKSPRMTLSGVYDAGPSDKISFSGGSQVVDGGIPPSLAEGFTRVNPGSQAEFMLGKWEHKIADDNVLTFTSYVNDFQLQASRVLDYRYQQLALEMNHTFKPSDEHTFTWGIDGRDDLMDATNADPKLLSKSFVSTQMIGLYAQDEWRFAPKWMLSLGGRVDYDSYAGFIPSGRVALSRQLTEDSSVYGAVSRAFKLMPSAVRFADAPFADGLLHFDSERDFVPNGQMGYELGYRGQFFKKLQTSVNLFWHESDHEGELPMSLGPPGLLHMHLQNGPTASLYGMEVENKYTVNEKLTLLANYTFEKFDWRGGEFTALTDNMTPPEHKFMLGARYNPLKDLHLSAHMYYVGATQSPNLLCSWRPFDVDPYLRLDLRAQYDFCKGKAFVAAGVRNLLDPQHLEGTSAFLHYGEVPRMVYAEIGFRLGK